MDPIRGDGVLLRLLEPPDRERWLELLHDPEQLRFGTPAVVPVPETLEDLDERLQAAERALGDGVPGTFAVASEEEPGRLLGIDRLGLPRPAPATGRDVGYGIRRGYLPLRDADAPDGVRRHDVCLHGLVPD